MTAGDRSLFGVSHRHLLGSGYPEGTLFPWVVSGFSLIDTFRSYIVKVPRLPVQDLAGAHGPIYQHVYAYIQKYGKRNSPRPAAASSRGRGTRNNCQANSSAPCRPCMAIRESIRNWQAKGGQTSLAFIVVCNHTATSKLVFDWIAGYEREAQSGAAQRSYPPTQPSYPRKRVSRTAPPYRRPEFPVARE